MAHANTLNMELTIKTCTIEEVEAVAVVAPTSCQGFMSQGAGNIIRRIGGINIEKEILDIAPIAIGAAAVTGAGDLPGYSHIIHVPNRLSDRAPARIEHIRQSVRAGLVAAYKMGFDTLVIPGPGPCASLISTKEIARAMIDEIKNFKENPPVSLILVDPNPAITRNLDAFAFPQK
jgi:O-acetyl-ADP-ribose deacetylase